MKALLCGWFSFEGMGATAGDLYARDLVAAWLEAAGVAHDVALAPPFRGGVDWRRADPDAYSHVVFVCGPFGNGPPVVEFLERFRDSRRVGVNLSMLQPLEEWNPFDLLLERDSSRGANPDISFLSEGRKVPVVGRVLVQRQEEYGDRALHSLADGAIDALLERQGAAPVDIDTRLDRNAAGLEEPAQVESLIARMDLVVTTRLHGTVLALKNGVPAIPVDPIRGGAKILRQVRTLGWPLVFTADALDPARLDAAFAFCLTDEARREARDCAERARSRIGELRARFIAWMRGSG